MSKSIYVVGAIGLGGCLVLSLMMQHLLKVHGERARPKVAIELEEDLADHLAGAVEATSLEVDGERTLCLRLPVKQGVATEPLARAAADLLWRRSPKWAEVPQRLRLEIVQGGAAPMRFDSHPPGLRTRRGSKTLAPVAPPK